nr:uncharacterized protein LOC110374004 [Helicoverpa armigera]
MNIEGNLTPSETNQVITEILTNVEHSLIPETMKFEDLKISHWDENDEMDMKLEKDRVENFEDYVPSREIISRDPQSDEIPEFEGNKADYPFPPVLSRKKKKRRQDDDACSLFVLQSDSDGASDQPSYDSEDTCDNFVECGEKGMCKCRRMQGRQYYDYFLETQEQEIHTMYPRGRAVLPVGAVLHFTVNIDAPALLRENIKNEFLRLGAKVEFVDYQKGHKEGWVRLSFPHEARIIIRRMKNKKLIIANAELTFRVISGKEEKRYLEYVIEEMFHIHKKAQSRKLKNQLHKAGFQYFNTYYNLDNKKKKPRTKPKGNPSLDSYDGTQKSQYEEGKKKQPQAPQCEGEKNQSSISQCIGDEGQSNKSQCEENKDPSKTSKRKRKKGKPCKTSESKGDTGQSKASEYVGDKVQSETSESNGKNNQSTTSQCIGEEGQSDKLQCKGKKDPSKISKSKQKKGKPCKTSKNKGEKGQPCKTSQNKGEIGQAQTSPCQEEKESETPQCEGEKEPSNKSQCKEDIGQPQTSPCQEEESETSQCEGEKEPSNNSQSKGETGQPQTSPGQEEKESETPQCEGEKEPSNNSQCEGEKESETLQWEGEKELSNNSQCKGDLRQPQTSACQEEKELETPQCEGEKE